MEFQEIEVDGVTYEVHPDVERAHVEAAIETATEHSPASPGAQKGVIAELAEIEAGVECLMKLTTLERPKL